MEVSKRLALKNKQDNFALRAFANPGGRSYKVWSTPGGWIKKNYPWTWAGITKDEAPGREEGKGHEIEINLPQPKESKYTIVKIDALDFEAKSMTRN